MDITAIFNPETGMFEVKGVNDDGVHELPAGIKLQAAGKREANNRILLAAEQLHGLGFNVKPVRLKILKGVNS